MLQFYKIDCLIVGRASFVCQKDGSLKLCIGYRVLNQVTIKNKYPLPQIDDLFDQFKKVGLFLKINLRVRYHQLKIRDVDVAKRTFRIWYGPYEVAVYILGSQCTDSVHYRDDFVIIFLVDIIIYSDNEKLHEKHL